MTTLPTWLFALLGLAGPVVAGLAVLASELRDRRRLEHERESQRLEMEERRLATLREDRMRAYSELARKTKALRPTPHEEAGDLVEILSEIELLTDDPRLLEVAGELVGKAGRARIASWKLQERNEGTIEELQAAADEVTECRTRFIRAAKEELGAKPDRS